MGTTIEVFVEPSTYFIFLCAIGTICLGSSLSTATRAFLRSSDGEQQRQPGAAGVQPVTLTYVLVLPVVGSLVLVLLFFLLKMMFYLILIVLAIVGLCSLWYLWSEPIESFLRLQFGFNSLRYSGPSIRDKILHYLPSLLSLACSLTVVIWWACTRAWPLSNLIALHTGITSLSLLRIPSMKIGAALLGLFFLYDIFWVFLSGYIFGSSVMEKVALGMLPAKSEAFPILITFPYVVNGGGSNLLGMGDIIMPGLYLGFLYRLDVTKRRLIAEGRRSRRKRFLIQELYFPLGMLCYSLGFFFTMGMLVILQRGQPALLYLVPAVLIPSLLQALWLGELPALWRGELSCNLSAPTIALAETSQTVIPSTSEDLGQPDEDQEHRRE